MEAKTTKIELKAIAMFYVIAVGIRAIVLSNEVLDSDSLLYWLWIWAEGIGPCIGAIIAVLFFKRRFYCSIVGRSFLKSIITVIIPLSVCFVANKKLCLTMMCFIFYSLLEEVGWRGFLQGELRKLNPTLRVLIISSMWFLWHLSIGLNLDNLVFWGILTLGSWGIGIIAHDTQSLIACACFHTIFNFSIHGYFQFTTFVIILYILVFFLWIAIWSISWNTVMLRLSSFINRIC